MITLFKERYEVVATLGSGGEAQIVKALDRQHGRFVALKIRPVRDDGAREDLLNEARVLLALPPHAALPLVREDFFDRDDYVVAMDWVDGTDLATLLADRGRPGLAPSSVLGYLAQAAEALTHLHSQSPPVIHGDVKPGNLILTKGGRIKLVDFGLSSAPTGTRPRAGTPGYRAPELAAGDSPSRATDVYALAATAFALLTGAAPAGLLPAWEGIDPAHAEQFEAAIRLGMATDPARRPTTPGELVERLRAGWSAALPTGVVTFCCSDIESSTALWENHPEAMAEVLVRQDELIADAVETGGGSLIKSIGDSTISVFHSAAAAVAAALAANRSLTAEEWPPGIRIAARWGIHTGQAERRDADYAGPTVNLAGRVRDEAGGGEILLSAVTAELVAADLPDGCSLVDLGPHRLTGHIHALEGPGVHTPPSAMECPYRGLLAFEADDRAFFFGREAVVAELVDRVAPGRLLTVVGASGSGKSSVLRAGLVAAARSGEIAGVEDAVVTTPDAELHDDPGVLFVVDQFEELFSPAVDAGRREAFIDALLRLRCPVAIGMRADLYGRLGAHAELARAVARNQVLLGAMTAAELERVVREPARLAGLKLEPGLVELILRDVEAEPGALPLLSHALRATWERRDGRTLTVAGYRESGGVASAIARTADSVVDALPDDQRRLVRSVCLRMTELGEGAADSRRKVTVDELVPEGASPESVRAVLERLADARLLTLDDGRAEVAHEALIREWPQLRRWLEEDRAGIRAHRRLSDAARLWDAGGRETSDLYRGARLAGALELTAELNATERAFLDAGVAEADRERSAERRVNRRLRGLLVATSVLMVVAIAGAVVSLVSRSNAREAEVGAQAVALTSDAERVGALAQTAPTLEHSMLYGAAAVELEDRVETRGALLAALQRNPAAIRTLRPSAIEIMALAVSPDGRLLATGDDVGVVRFIDLRAWRLSGAPVRLPRRVAAQAMRFSPDGRTLAVGTRKGNRAELHLVDVASHGERRIGSWRGYAEAPTPTTALAFAPSGRRLAVSLATMSTTAFTPVAGRLLLLDARSGRPVWQRRYPLRPDQWETHVLFRSEGTLITSAQQGETLLWNTRIGRIVRRYRIGGRFDLSPDGRRLAIALNSPFPGEPSSSVAMLDLRTGRHTELIADLSDAWITSLAFTRDGARIVGAAMESTHVWDASAGTIVETYGSNRGPALAGAVVDPRGVVIDGRNDGSVSAWDMDGARRLGRRFRWSTEQLTCNANPCTVVDPRGAMMATSLGDGTVALIDLRSKRMVTRLPAVSGEVAEGLAFTSDGRRLVVGGIAGTVTIWDVESRAVVRRLAFREPVWAVAISPDSRLLAVQRQREGSSGAHVEVRDLEAGRTVHTHRLRFGLGELAFTGDGRLLVAGSTSSSDGSTVVGWDARSGARRFEVPAGARIWAFALSPDSRRVAVGTADGRAIFWDLRSGRRQGAATKVAAGAVGQLAFSPDGRLLAVGAADRTATVWDVRSRTRIGGTFPVAKGVLPAVVFEPNGRLLITELVSAIEWPLDLPTMQRFACQVAGRDLTREEWRDLLPSRPHRPVCRS